MRLHLLALGALLALSGCVATAPIQSSGDDLPPNGPLSPLATGPMRPAIPSGPLRAITAEEVTSQAIARLQPPADMWERIRRGKAPKRRRANSAKVRYPSSLQCPATQIRLRAMPGFSSRPAIKSLQPFPSTSSAIRIT